MRGTLCTLLTFVVRIAHIHIKIIENFTLGKWLKKMEQILLDGFHYLTLFLSSESTFFYVSRLINKKVSFWWQFPKHHISYVDLKCIDTTVWGLKDFLFSTFLLILFSAGELLEKLVIGPKLIIETQKIIFKCFFDQDEMG